MVAQGADVVVTDAVDVASGADEAVLVTLAALARSAPGPVPPGAVDEARELATHGDVFDAVGRAGRRTTRPCARGAGTTTPTTRLVPRRAGAAPSGCTRRRPTRRRSSALALDAWAADGSLVLTRGEPADDVLRARLDGRGRHDDALTGIRPAVR